MSQKTLMDFFSSPNRTTQPKPQTQLKRKSSPVATLTKKAKLESPKTEPIKRTKQNTAKNSEWPEFLLPENIKDSQGRRPDHPDYDPSTLYVPKDYKFTPAMKQYWDEKAKYFDKIVLFKLGKFYEIFYYDAVICNRVLDLKWMGDDEKKAHVGFPEKALERKANTLIENGYKVVVIEQTENTLKNKKQKSGKTVGREVTAIYTKGTYVKEDCFEGRYLLSFVEAGDLFGFTLVEISTGSFQIGEVDELGFRTILTQKRPSEVLYFPNLASQSTVKIVKNSPIPPVLTALRQPEKWCVSVIHSYFNEVPLSVAHLPTHSALKAFAGTISYLEEVFLSEKLLPNAGIEEYNPKKLAKQCMFLDNKALEHLEVLEANDGEKVTREGSLIDYLDKAVTPFGKRKLKNWVSLPLLEPHKIEERLNCVEELYSKPEIISGFDRLAKKLPDLERMLSRISTYSIKTNSKAIYFEDVSSQKIKEFCKLTENLKYCQSIIEELSDFCVDSHKLSLLFQKEPQGIFPSVQDICEAFEGMIHWDQGNPVPAPGVCPEYEQVKQECHLIEEKLQEVLVNEREKLGDKSINWVHSKFRYELEVPERMAQSLSSEYEITSVRKGFYRYHTKRIKKLADQLDISEDKLKEQLKPFIFNMLKQFYLQKEVWDRVVFVISEIDCLCSLAKVVISSPFPMSRPKFTEQSCLRFENLVHPVLACTSPSFVSNSLEFNSDYKCYVLTGPNMGGKSTLLRQVGLACIMAQIGSFVPANKFELSPVDQIITRLGASDSLLEGKSTFYLEMEEAAKVFLRGTKNSLVIMDELGRGTSTLDGAALAYSTLKHIAESLQARTLFTTHYHMIIKDLVSIPNLKLAHMDSLLDQASQKVTFLFKVKEGVCPKSYGINVARIAGVPESVLVKAQVKATEIEQIIN